MVNALWENVFKKSDSDDIWSALNKNILFHDLSRKELKFVRDIVHVREYRPGEKVFSQGEVGVGMYIIVRGMINIVVEDLSNQKTERKRDIPITRLSDGDFFGELSLVEENGRRNASAIASEDSKVIGFFKPDLMEIMERNTNIGSKIVFRLSEVLGRRLQKTTESVSQLRKEIQKLSERA